MSPSHLTNLATRFSSTAMHPIPRTTVLNTTEPSSRSFLITRSTTRGLQTQNIPSKERQKTPKEQQQNTDIQKTTQIDIRDNETRTKAGGANVLAGSQTNVPDSVVVYIIIAVVGLLVLPTVIVFVVCIKRR